MLDLWLIGCTVLNTILTFSRHAQPQITITLRTEERRDLMSLKVSSVLSFSLSIDLMNSACRLGRVKNVSELSDLTVLCSCIPALC